jgi:Protein of unknown function (DUF2934)
VSRSRLVKLAKNANEQLVSVNEMIMNNTNEHAVSIKESEIGVVAYQMWEKAGHPAGRDLQFWLDAERQLRAAAKVAYATPAVPRLPVTSNKNAGHKAASGQLRPSRPNSATAQQRVRRF